MRKALVWGITGQDGSYLTEMLLSKGYDVHGVIRRQSVVQNQMSRLDHIIDQVTTYYGDVNDPVGCLRIMDKVKPHEVYNLAAQSHVRISFEEPHYTFQTNAVGAMNVFEACRLAAPDGVCVYQASSSEMFGNSMDEDGFQRETTPMKPVSPYGIAKLAAYNFARYYRDAMGMLVCNGILFNHSSPRRGWNFVEAKIVRGALRIKDGRQVHLRLGNLDAHRDFGHSKDYVEAMWLMLQDEPDDYVVASGLTYSVRDICHSVFSKLGMDWEAHVRVDDCYRRPKELHRLKGDATKAREQLNWLPTRGLGDILDESIEHHAKQMGIEL